MRIVRDEVRHDLPELGAVGRIEYIRPGDLIDQAIDRLARRQFAGGDVGRDRIDVGLANTLRRLGCITTRDISNVVYTVACVWTRWTLGSADSAGATDGAHARLAEYMFSLSTRGTARALPPYRPVGALVA